MKALANNPLLIKEMREEIRSRKVLVIVSVYIAILSAIALVAVGTSNTTTFNPLMMAGNARYTLFAFAIAISILLGLIGIIFGASSFTTERERATYELLELTPLTYTDLVLGKFLHAFIVAGVILLCSLPIVSTLFFMGGLNYQDLLLTFFYLLIFFAVSILGSLCISIVASRTIISIILSSILAFVLSIVLLTSSGNAFREPAALGFGVLSPWLVIWRQIFAPVPLKLAGVSCPIWVFYLLLYLLLARILIAWGHNALDVRKLQRNRSVRILGTVFINAYIAIGLLCALSYHPITAKHVEDFFQVVMVGVVATLPFFGFGTFTDKDQIRFRKHPILDSIHPARLFLNYPATGFSFLIILLVSVSVTVVVCSGVPWKSITPYLGHTLLWVAPWALLLLAMRLGGFRSRGLFVCYLLGILLVSLISTFYHSAKAATDIFDFFLPTPVLLTLYPASIIYYLMMRIRLARSR